MCAAIKFGWGSKPRRKSASSAKKSKSTDRASPAPPSKRARASWLGFDYADPGSVGNGSVPVRREVGVRFAVAIEAVQHRDEIEEQERPDHATHDDDRQRTLRFGADLRREGGWQ